jgi:cytochrome b subunit of formate dehydrogenase/mono/diheme cytochrome c family protein
MNAKKQSYLRFHLAQRLEHIILILSFTTLGLTGLPQKYPLAQISQAIIAALGGIETIRIIHRFAATIFLVEAIYHAVVAGYKLYVRREEASMLPTIKDGQDAFQAFLYNLGLRKDSPKMPRYNFAEKAEYWAMLWGLLVMAATGFMLWNPIATTNFFPGEFIPAAKVAHGGEAVLAVLAIILWHFWNVHLKMFNKSMFTGKLNRHEMEEEHGFELERIDSGRLPQPAPPQLQRQRLTIFIPVAAIISIVLLAGVYFFISFEKTSITTLPTAEIAKAFVPQTATPVPPTPTPAPTFTPSPTSNVPTPAGATAVSASIAWNNDLDFIFKQRCGTCHGTTGGFSALSYADVMKKISAGNPDSSDVVKVQQAGNHPGKFNPDELNRVIDWIKAGAPEAGAASSGGDNGTTAPLNSTWEGNVSGLFQAKCKTCHGSIGGFNAQTYANVLKKIEPGNPDSSDVVKVMQGTHPALFTPAELQIIIDWIKAGAPEK